MSLKRNESVGFFMNNAGLKAFNNFAGTNTSSTGPDVLDFRAHLRFDSLQVRFPFFLGGLMRMAYRIPENRAFSTDYALFWHC